MFERMPSSRQTSGQPAFDPTAARMRADQALARALALRRALDALDRQRLASGGAPTVPPASAGLPLQGAVGFGRENRPEDLRATRRRLAALGYAPAHRTWQDLPVFDPLLEAGLRAFQATGGLRTDGWMRPGGETERAINAELVRRWQPLSADATHPAPRFGTVAPTQPAHAEAFEGQTHRMSGGLLGPLPPGASGPVDIDRDSLGHPFPSRPGDFFDPKPRNPSPPPRGAQVANAGTFARSGLPLLSALTAGEIIHQLQTNRDLADSVARLGFRPEDVIGFLSGLTDGSVQSRSADGRPIPFAERLMSGLGQALSEAGPDFHPTPGSMVRAELTRRMEAAPELPTAFPHTPPEHPDDGEETFPAEEPQPVILVDPIPEEGEPALEIFPDMSDLLQQWLYVESRGTVDGQQKNLRYVLKSFYDALTRRGVVAHHKFGGYSVHDGEKLKERFISAHSKESGKKGVAGSRRSDGAFQIGDDEKHIIDINIVDTLADFVSMVKREYAAFEAIKYLKKEVHGEHGDTLAFPKSKGQDWDEWTKGIDERIENYVNAAYGPPPE